jgi:phage baseplate assembly protein W
MTTFYRGFSTINRAKKFRATDVDLVKQDLINHFSIRKGEKLMQPNFGSIIWSVLFEPLDDTTTQLIIDDVERIVGYDPRMSLDNIEVVTQDNGIQIALDMTYIPENQATSMTLRFNQDSKSLTTSGLY